MATQPQFQPLLPDNNGNGHRNGNGKAPTLIPIHPSQLLESQQAELSLRQLLAVAQRRKVLIAGVAIAVTSAIWAWTFSQTPQYEGKFQLLVESVTDEQNLEELTRITKTELPKTTGLDYDTQIQVLRSPELMAPIVKRLQTRYNNLDYEGLARNLIVMRLQQTKILEVRYRDSDPQQIKFVLDEVSDSYLKYSLQERQTALRQGIQFVETQLDKLQNRVDKLQQQLQTFRQNNQFIEPDIQSEQLSDQVKTIAVQQLETQKQLAEARALYDSLQGQAGATSVLIDAPLYQKLLGQLRDVESKAAIEASRFRPLNPTMQAFEDQRRNLIPLLQAEARRVVGDKLAGVATQIQVLEVRLQAIDSADAEISQQIKELPRLSRQYTDLQRELKVATDSLNRFLATRETLQVDAAQKEIPWQIISAPQRPEQPISPNVPRNLLLGAIAGLLLGGVAALLAERLDNTFHAPDDLKDLAKLPLLGIVPFNQDLPEKVAQTTASDDAPLQNPPNQYRSVAETHTTTVFAEAFRSLHANIRLLGSDTPIRSLVVSSALPGDGKSTVAMNLAQAAAAMGQRVLLVDADLRRPQVSRSLKLPNVRGLSNLISSDLDVRQVIQRVSDSHPEAIGSHLFVLTAGQIPPDPTKLLASKKMQNLIIHLHTVFDLVIYDTPPLIGLADSSLIAPHTDGIVLVVGLGRTDRTALTDALDNLKLAHTPVLGIVANGLKQHTASSYSHYYHQYYTPNNNSSPKKKFWWKK
jgi:polysaccharide biosynthesis transport protein